MAIETTGNTVTANAGTGADGLRRAEIEGQQVGILKTPDALSYAQERDLERNGVPGPVIGQLRKRLPEGEYRGPQEVLSALRRGR